MEMVMLMVGLMMVGMMAVMLIILNHVLKVREKARDLEMIKQQLVPEVERMSKQMLNDAIDVTCTKMVEMTKKMMDMDD